MDYGAAAPHVHYCAGVPHRPGRSSNRADGLGINVAPGSLGALVRSYKAAVAWRINQLRETPGATLWQRG